MLGVLKREEKPKLERILQSESKLDCEQLIKDAIASEEIVNILPNRD